MEAIGRVRRMLAQSGSFHTMRKATTMLATGTVRAGVSSMTITGTMTTIGITVAGTKTTASTKAGTKKIVTTTIATKKLNQFRWGTFLRKCPAFFLRLIFIGRFVALLPGAPSDN